MSLAPGRRQSPWLLVPEDCVDLSRMEVVLEDLTSRTLEEVFQTDAVNRAWSKELRGKAAVLVNDRLADRISLAEYAEERRQVNENMVECRRRGWILSTEIESRRARPKVAARPNAAIAEIVPSAL